MEFSFLETSFLMVRTRDAYCGAGARTSGPGGESVGLLPGLLSQNSFRPDLTASQQGGRAGSAGRGAAAGSP